MTRTEAADAPRTVPRSSPPGLVLVLACVAQFMVVLDVSVVNVALPSIQTSLDFAAADLPWVAGAYTLAFAGFLLLGGRLADLYGTRRVLVAGLLLFSMPSLVGGLATAPAVLVAARAAQGLGAAVLAPATLTLLTTTFPEGPRRTRALAVWTAVSLAGGATGNLIGGVLTQTLSWRWILLINVPIGAAALCAAVRVPARHHRNGTAARLDLPGAASVTAGLALLAYGIMRVGPRGWGDPVTAVALAAAAVLLAGFVLIETRLARDPLIPLRLFRLRAVSAGNTIMLLAGACFQVPMWYFLTLYMQDVLHYTALETGLGFLPHTLLTMVIGLRITPRLMKRADDRTLIIAGALVAAAGFLWQSRIGAGSDYLSGVLGPAIPISLGGGLLNTPLTTTVTSGVAGRDAGAASGLMNTAKQVGGALGLAALTAALAGRATTSPALAEAYGDAFLIMAVMAAAIAAASLTLPARRDAAVSARAG
ncbi:EmrB/QacA subfamily drug resistance transporter [Actinomadura coerulea]|uniref:EmrB/QacA subfamily drug resistance transporter n=1 Tax=Actinomadura coerulea TaxID=46159 RepID=A0A7X0FY04_9ACTN|nr:MFS transporter [Actinomadura coerulea]MBB6395624.1 EmrB/QacA subfamily drug resistance transporter [Actinomadura coerulea]